MCVHSLPVPSIKKNDNENLENMNVRVPLAEYTASVTESFPYPAKQRAVETSVLHRRTFDTLPINQPLSGALTDNYLEFRIPGIEGRFIDLSTIILELDVAVIKGDGTAINTDEDRLTLINGLGGGTIFKSVTCFLNETLVESNPVFTQWSMIRQLTGFRPSQLQGLGSNAFFHKEGRGNGNTHKFTEDYFNNLKDAEKTEINDYLTHGANVTAPLFLDLASLDEYLLDNVSLRIRLELASNQTVINTHLVDNNYTYRINSARLWLHAVTPYPDALNALNSAMIDDNESVNYVFNKTLYKTYVLAGNQTSLLMDNPFGQAIPEKLYVVLQDLDAFTGSYNYNAIHFLHGKVNRITVTINGTDAYDITADYPRKYSKLYATTLEALGYEKDHMISKFGFKSGSCVMMFDLRKSTDMNTVPLEINGSMRLNLTLERGATQNRVVLLFGETRGVLTINPDRRVTTDFRA